MTLTIDHIREAARQLKGAIVETPTTHSRTLSQLCGAEIFLKLENLQYTASFKDRGSLNKLLSLDAGQRKAGVVAASAGNHAQGVAYHAQRLGIPATIVMPLGTPFTKVVRTRDFGAEIVLHGEGVADAAAMAHKLSSERGLTFVHPYDDELVIAGQGTVAFEMLFQEPSIDTLVIPVGGGGLIGGCAIAAKALKPDLKIYGVEAQLFPSMYNALRGQPPRSGGQTIAEGIAVKDPGKLTLPIVRDLVEDLILVDESALEQAVQLLLEIEKTVAEGAGAAALAAVLAARKAFAGRRVGLVISGGNIDSRLLASVLMRGLVREGRLVRLRVEISDAPGMLSKVAAAIGSCGGNIVEIYHQRLFHDVPVKHADLDVVVETRDAAHGREIMAKLVEAGLAVRQLGSSAAESH
jgi:threonine dehydratase